MYCDLWEPCHGMLSTLNTNRGMNGRNIVQLTTSPRYLQFTMATKTHYTNSVSPLNHCKPKQTKTGLPVINCGARVSDVLCSIFFVTQYFVDKIIARETGQGKKTLTSDGTDRQTHTQLTENATQRLNRPSGLIQ